MRKFIFSESERKTLEAFLTKVKVDEHESSKITEQIKNCKTLFEDVFLYLRVRKEMSD